MRRIITGLTTLALMAGTTALAEQGIRPGKWQVTQTVESGAVSMPPQTLTFCHKATDVKTPLPSQPMPDNCKIVTMEHSGATTRWQFSCSGKDSMQGSGEMTHQHDSYQGVMRMRSSAGEMKTRMNGKRLGDC